MQEKFFKNIRWNGFKSVFLALGSLIQLYILVRFLEKEDFGLMAMANIIITFAYLFIELGLTNAIIFKQDVSNQQLSVLYYTSIGIGLLLSLIVLALAPLFSLFFNAAALQSILNVVALLFFINSFGQLHKALFSKLLKFEFIAKVESFSFFISFWVSVILAIKGLGAYSLVFGLLVKTSLESLLFSYFGRRIFKPEFSLNLKESHFFFRFGLFQMGENILNVFNKQLDLLLIGKFLGPELLGGYDIIKKLLSRPIQLISPILLNVSFPTMATLQDQNKKLGQVFLRQLNYLCSINFPIYFFLFFNSGLVIQFFFGPEWIKYSFVFKMLAIYFVFYAAGYPIGSLILSKGRVDLGLKWNLLVTVLISIVLYVGLKWSLPGIVIGLVIMQFLLIIPFYFFLIKKLLTTTFFHYYSIMLTPLVLSIVTGLFTYLLSSYSWPNQALNLLGITVGGMLFYSLLIYVFNRPFKDDILKLLRLS